MKVMTVKEQLKRDIDQLDEGYLHLLHKIVCQFPRVAPAQQEDSRRQEIASLLQEIADAGGLGIADPQAWQREIRADRSLPYRPA
ncbi:MAG: hypothetical protein ACTFAK_12770 [Candidatus Electronema sp. VV]